MNYGEYRIRCPILRLGDVRSIGARKVTLPDWGVIKSQFKIILLVACLHDPGVSAALGALASFSSQSWGLLPLFP